MTVIVADQQLQEESTSKVLRIMMFLQPMSDCRQSDTRGFVISANLFAAQSVCPSIRQFLVGPFFGTQKPSLLAGDSAGLPGEESPYPPALVTSA